MRYSIPTENTCDTTWGDKMRNPFVLPDDSDLGPACTGARGGGPCRRRLAGALAAGLSRTLDLEPRHFGALTGLGMIYLKLDQERAALEALEKALVINPHLRRARQKVQELHDRLDGRMV